MWVSFEKKDGYAILQIHKEPVNAFNLSLWQELRDSIQLLEQDEDVRGVIICSGLKRDLFTAGNDLGELYAPNTSLERYRLFWKTSNAFLAHLLVSPLITVAAIRGQCPAGGCMLSLCCDYRLMTDFGKIGLNEVGLGIPVPGYWGELFGMTTGHGRARSLLLSGSMIPSSKALEIELINEVCTKESLLPRAEAYMQRMLKIPIAGRIGTKKRMFDGFAKRWVASLDEEAELAFEFLSRPKNVQFLKSVIDMLSNRKAQI